MKFVRVFIHTAAIMPLRKLLSIRGMVSQRTCMQLGNRLLHNNVSYTNRTQTCGGLRETDIGKTVQLCGWLQYHRMGGLFLILRDWQGLVQCIVSQEKESLLPLVRDLNYETVVEVHGKVHARPAGQENKNLETGMIEVHVEDLKILNQSIQGLPFDIREFHDVKESLRMEYRYLDLRTKRMQRNLRLRSNMIMKMREFLCNKHGFVDVETPTLFRRTPGGAKEFIVPSRHPGKFYSLPQSPQQFKQLLMVGGIDRYFQVAKCYRDEGAKPERQPEFTQLDIEMSFVEMEGIQFLIEDLLHFSWPEDLEGRPETPFPRLTYQEAMRQYGIDKPDTRFDMTLTDVTKHLLDSGVQQFDRFTSSAESSIVAFRVPKGMDHMSLNDIQTLKEAALKIDDGKNKINIIDVRVGQNGEWKSSISKYLKPDTREKLAAATQLQSGDILFLAAGQRFKHNEILGRLRLECANHLQAKGIQVRDKTKFNFLWVQDFPLFLPKEDGSGLESAHHPFTAPRPDDIDLLNTHPEKVQGQHYDLVLNGNEIGGGSIRIHNADLQRYVLQDILKEDPSELKHLLEALSMGCPPHGGIALGLDRLFACLCNCDTIRDVIAFPKSSDGKDLMSQAPSPVSKADLERYHVEIKTESKK
ncbi:hypothetical protein CHS0354_003719 [Potamilus streckersoni]|uniref:Aminoacyl-transfer RNA synthetases class-II family profile domain-containing protein n=1 Tax=Potamilus streckersoni TaxID=2493646 RepID=A0AAE0SSZ9_9BIVA|nr:hypothetical protein CHS0354_003719 [Potamilus streckersoni]